MLDWPFDNTIKPQVDQQSFVRCRFTTCSRAEGRRRGAAGRTRQVQQQNSGREKDEGGEVLGEGLVSYETGRDEERK